jgi:hypothetical protein
MRYVGLQCLVLIALAAPASFACSATPLQLRKVPPEFTIAVTHRDKPIAGIEVRIFRARSTQPVFTHNTDERGGILVKHLSAGTYYVYASHQGFDAPTEWIEVVSRAGEKAARRIDIRWADWSYEISRVAGTLTGLIPGNTGNKLMDLVHPLSTTYPGVAIELKHAFSGEGDKSLSDSGGAFLFPDVPDETYILTIAGGMKSVSGVADITRLVLDVKQNSLRSSLPLELRDNGCGGTEFQLKEQ